ncbi:acyltransferase family protein [Pedobacter mucosus]|uniref:acyltransferase family protein n=1 Tax=Pedobacter mucosus TaxID=2895286 RepID=UPI001EE4515E|nr:acyltransferase [Pedobacter mucosus]UKT63954.1 acyltransferase [Pedobacter mucosus]
MPINKPLPNILKHKQHFQILDGLRGVAAVCVVIFHFMEFAAPDYHDNFIAHSYLAVDFFFCLSGFVIAYAYDTKIKEIGILTFFKMRLIRLHPLVIIGAILGLLTFIFDPYSKLFETYGLGKSISMFISACFLIPLPIVTERYLNLFHLNPPMWSLFWEYIANIFYALVLFKLPKKSILILAIVAAVILVFSAHQYGYIGVGWGGDTFIGGGARVLYSFVAGILVYKSKWIIKSPLGFLSLSFLLILAFLVPFSNKYSWIIDSIIVIIYFPLLVALGAGAHLRTNHLKYCKFSGDISYPLYMIHYPFLWMFLSYVELNKPTMGQMATIIPIGTILFIGLAYLTLIYVDLPIRKYLISKMKR